MVDLLRRQGMGVNGSAVPLKRRVRRGVRRLGLDVHRYLPERDFDARRMCHLRDQRVDVVVDGGANVGQWALDLRSCGYRGLILSFEPVTDAFVGLCTSSQEDPSWRCIQAALGDTDGDARMHVAGNSLSSSLLDMEPVHVAAAPQSGYVRSETVKVVRLDTVVPNVVPAGSTLALKLDLQGYEAAALAGAAGILSSVRLVECELSVVPLYRGQPLYVEMIDLLAGLGFVMIGLSEGMIDPSTGCLMQIDAVFVRGGRPPASPR